MKSRFDSRKEIPWKVKGFQIQVLSIAILLIRALLKSGVYMLAERDLARKALALKNNASFDEVLKLLVESQKELFHYQHHIVQYLTHRLRNLSVPNPESTSLIRCERIVTRMADIEEEYEIQSNSGSATPAATHITTASRPVQPITVYDRCRAKGAGR